MSAHSPWSSVFYLSQGLPSQGEGLCYSAVGFGPELLAGRAGTALVSRASTW